MISPRLAFPDHLQIPFQFFGNCLHVIFRNIHTSDLFDSTNTGCRGASTTTTSSKLVGTPWSIGGSLVNRMSPRHPMNQLVSIGSERRIYFSPRGSCPHRSFTSVLLLRQRSSIGFSEAHRRAHPFRLTRPSTAQEVFAWFGRTFRIERGSQLPLRKIGHLLFLWTRFHIHSFVLPQPCHPQSGGSCGKRSTGCHP